MYTEHEMNVVLFDKQCVFADLEVSGGPEGGIVVNSLNPDVADI